ncbi:hypothetical protein ACI8AK_17325 [Geodermatophilus sp. SYSU D00867]
MRRVLEKNCPECHWVTVTDADGRRRIEMRWGSPQSAAQAKPRRAA